MDSGKISTRFRKQLKEHLGLWRTEGLVTGEQADTISQRYDLDGLADESTARLLMLVYAIGTILIGAGVISFVAAHWEAIGKTPKVIMLTVAMLAAHGFGYYLWQVKGNYPRLGHILVLLGSLIFGANIGLLAQIFHVSSHPYNGLAAWAIGTMVVAYAVGSLPNAILALIVSFIYWINWRSSNWDEFSLFPLVAAAVFLTFAFLHRSRLMLALSVIAVTISGIWAASGTYSTEILMPMTALFLGAAWFLAGLACRGGVHFDNFSPIFLGAGTLLIAAVLYIYSFFDAAHDVVRDLDLSRNIPSDLLMPVVAALAAIVLLPLAIRQSLGRTVFLALAAVASASALMWVGSAILLDNSLVLNIAANACFFGLAASLLWASFVCEDRRIFWTGSIMIGLLVTGRFFEYDTGLMLKAAVFIACGISLIVAGVMFERYLKTRRPAHE